MKMLSVISLKKKEEPLLPQTVETTAEDPTDQEQGKPEMVEDTKDESAAKAKLATTSTKTKKKKKFLRSFLDVATSVLFMVLWLAPGFLLGFSGGSYYQYKKLAPYVNQNWKLSTELWKVENILYVMNNVLVYEEKGEAEKWFYRVRQGVIECNYSPNTPSTTTASTSTSTTTTTPTTTSTTPTTTTTTTTTFTTTPPTTTTTLTTTPSTTMSTTISTTTPPSTVAPHPTSYTEDYNEDYKVKVDTNSENKGNTETQEYGEDYNEGDKVMEDTETKDYIDEMIYADEYLIPKNDLE